MFGTTIDQSGHAQTLWSGELRVLEETPPATPQVIRQDDLSLVFATGILTFGAALETVSLVTGEARKPDVKTVIVALALPATEIRGLAAAVSALDSVQRRAELVAFTEVALGGALFLALKIGRVYAPPEAKLGLVRCGLADGTTDWDATEQLALTLHENRRWVEQSTWRGLRDHWVNGEQAEAYGISEMIGDFRALVGRYQEKRS